MSRTVLGLIFAQARNGVIGKDGVLPWHLPEDLAHFRRVTMGHPVIMGRKTWESLPIKFKPLPGRPNIVVTRQADWQAEGAQRAASLDEAVALSTAYAAPPAWIIGGAEVFNDSLALAQRCEVTEIDADFEGDVFAPKLTGPWKETARERHVSASGVPYSFVTYTNIASNTQGD